MKRLPDSVSAYKRTPVFTKSSVPKGLLAKHNTKKDTWGLIVVESGSLNYIIFENNESSSDYSTILTSEKPGVIEPQVCHKVELLSDDTTFFVEFYANDKEDIGIPKFMNDKDVSDVNLESKGKAEGALNSFQSLSIQIVVVGMLAIVVGVLLVQVSDVMQSWSYTEVVR